MFTKPHCPVIAIEEHYRDEELAKTTSRRSGRPGRAAKSGCYDFGPLRIKEMDDVGIESAGDLARRAVDAKNAALKPRPRLTRRVNDRLHAQVGEKPADASPPSPACRRGARPAAADEVERCVKELGFKGAMLHGLAKGTFLDDRKFWPIYARRDVDVPIYLQPPLPQADGVAHLLRRLRQGLPAWRCRPGATRWRPRRLRSPLVLSGVFERHPKPKIILGHLGETLPFLVRRVDQALSAPGQKSLSFRDIFCGNYYITTSGNFSNPALLLHDGDGRRSYPSLFDWPFVMNPRAPGPDAHRAAL